MDDTSITDVLSYSYTISACVRARKAPPFQPSSEAERRGNISKGSRTFIGKPGPGSGPDCLECAECARQRVGVFLHYFGGRPRAQGSSVPALGGAASAPPRSIAVQKPLHSSRSRALGFPHHLDFRAGESPPPSSPWRRSPPGSNRPDVWVHSGVISLARAAAAARQRWPGSWDKSHVGIAGATLHSRVHW